MAECQQVLFFWARVFRFPHFFFPHSTTPTSCLSIAYIMSGTYIIILRLDEMVFPSPDWLPWWHWNGCKISAILIHLVSCHENKVALVLVCQKYCLLRKIHLSWKYWRYNKNVLCNNTLSPQHRDYKLSILIQLQTTNMIVLLVWQRGDCMTKKSSCQLATAVFFLFTVTMIENWYGHS